MMSIRKMHEALKEKGIEVSTGTVANAIRTFILQNPTTERCLKPQHSVHTHDILRLLTEGKTIEEISKVLNISIRTVKRYIKKAKQEGLITNMGSDKYPKWTMEIAQNVTVKPERNDMKNENKIAQNGTVKPESNITQENISRVIKSLKSIDEYLYYTGEGKDKFDEWFDFSLANS